jgi:hypothetical protein
MHRYYQHPDTIYGMPAALQPHLYSAASPSHAFVGGQASAEWVTQPDPILASGPPVQEPAYAPTYGFAQSDSQESVDVYVIPQYAMNTYDSFEFQTLREHSMNTALASQAA